MKHALLNVMRYGGGFIPFRMINRCKAFILTYHRFSKCEEQERISERAFAEQVEYLSKHYKIVPLSHLAKYLSNGADLARGLVAITIDDGYRDAYTIALPILRRYNVPATVFVVTDFVDQRIWLWPDKLRYLTLMTESTSLEATVNGCALRCVLDDRISRLEAAGDVNTILKKLGAEEREEVISRIARSVGVRLPDLPPGEFSAVGWDQVREMHASGVEIGSHTVTHPILTSADEEDIGFELAESKHRLEVEIGRRVDLFCYPNGDFNCKIRAQVSSTGYKCAVTVWDGFIGCHADPLTLPRIHSEKEMAYFMQSVSGFGAFKSGVRRLACRRGAMDGEGDSQIFSEAEGAQLG